MTPEEAVAKIRETGLHVHLNNNDIIGGGYVDRSNGLTFVKDEFWMLYKGTDNYELGIERLNDHNNKEKVYVTLEEGVNKIIKTVTPGKDIECNIKSSDDVQYY